MSAQELEQMLSGFLPKGMHDESNAPQSLPISIQLRKIP